MTSKISPHVWFPEPRLSFHPEHSDDVEIHPLRGLLRFGPYSSGLIPDPIRVATISPKGESTILYRFMNELKREIKPTERKDYLPVWPGFSNVFNVHMRAAPKNCHLQLDEEVSSEMKNSAVPHVVLSTRLIGALQILEGMRQQFDVIFIYIPEAWSIGFHGGEEEDFDLHDLLKANSAAQRIPIQLVREDKALAYPHRASVMWRIGLALYAKAGGIPWKLAHSDPETAYIGISYAVRPQGSERARFVTCCSQVFDGDGAGLEFVAYDANEVEVHRDNPFLSRNEMFRVMTRSLDLYRRRHSGRTPRRIVVHKTTEFKREEVEGCMEAFHLCESVDLIQVVEDLAWRGIKIDPPKGSKKGTAAAYPVERGTVLGLGQRECLFWMHGNVGELNSGNAYFQGGKGTPKPIKLIRHAGHGPWDETVRSAMALSKMNWNNDALYDQLPVTMSYAKVLARVVKRMSGLGTSPYQFRFFM